MSEYTAELSWICDDTDFLANRYSRRHAITFDGGHCMPASSSPSVVPEPFSDATAVDPEEAFVASLSSCHMLWFLSIAVKRRRIVDAYRDTPVGVMEKNSEGRLAMTRVTLRPEVRWAEGHTPDAKELHRLHHLAHQRCFIAQSVKSEIVVEPVKWMDH